jgi:hypothetical protein
MKEKIAVLLIVTGTYLGATALAAQPIAPLAPWAPGVNKAVAQLNNEFKPHHGNKAYWLKQSCTLPTAVEVGIEPFPGSLLINAESGDPSSNVLPSVTFASKAPLKKVMTWYRAKYPSLKLKSFPDSPGPGVFYATTDKSQYEKAGMMAVFDADGVLTGCNGMIAAPRSYETKAQIYYQPHGH